MIELYQGYCLEVMKHMDDNSVDAIVTDPPYGLRFMGKKWDYEVPSVETWEECLRVLKPGGTALIFAGSRTQHRMAVNIEDAGFILKDTIMWIYGGGFPKSTNISKQIGKLPDEYLNTKSAKLWEGWHSHGIKPAYEPVIIAQKQNDGTYANNALKHGVAGLNIDACRIESTDDQLQKKYDSVKNCPSRENNIYGSDKRKRSEGNVKPHPSGRFPSNIIHDGSEEVVSLFPNTKSGKDKNPAKNSSSGFTGNGIRTEDVNYGDSGSAARFFYCSKSSKSERNAGLKNIGKSLTPHGSRLRDIENADWSSVNGNFHPTVKPLSLMEYLCKLVTMPGGSVILDPFMGSGTTGIACKMTGNSFIGIEKETDYFEIAKARINHKEN